MSDDPLDQINRFVIVLLALVVAFAAIAIVMFAWGAPSASIDRIESFAGWLRDHNHDEAKLILTLGAIIVALLMLVTVIVEITPSPIQKMRIRNVGSGDATLTTKRIADRIDAEVAALDHIAACRSTVAARGKRAEVVLDLDVDPGSDLARTADEACRKAHMLVAREMKIDLVKPPRARLHYRELRLRENPSVAGSKNAAAPAHTGWERPQQPEGERDQRGNADSPEEAQA